MMKMSRPSCMRRPFLFLSLNLSLASSLVLTACGDTGTIVRLETEAGPIEIEVYEDKAPITAADFLYYVDNGLYDGEGFYRTVKPETDQRGQGLQIIQGGRLDVQRVTAEVDLESTAMTGLTHIDGAVGIARNAGISSGSAAFFYISIGENKMLDHGGERLPDGQGLAVFGQVLSGMDVVRAIQDNPTVSGTPEDPALSQYMIVPVLINKASRK